MEEIGDGQVVVVQKDFLFRGEEPLPDRQAGARHGRSVVLHVELVGKFVGSQLPNCARSPYKEGEGGGNNQDPNRQRRVPLSLVSKGVPSQLPWPGPK